MKLGRYYEIWPLSRPLMFLDCMHFYMASFELYSLEIGHLAAVVSSLIYEWAAQGDDSSPPPLCGLIFFEGDRCLCLTLKFVERLKCYSAKPNESCIIFGIYYFISCLISIVILSLCIFLFLLSFLVRYRVKTMHEKEKMCQTVA